MSESNRTSLKVLLTVVFGLFSLPMLSFGGYFLVCWFRIHTSDVYYVAFSYLTAGVIWIRIGILSFLATLYGAWRRSFYGLLFLAPLFSWALQQWSSFPTSGRHCSAWKLIQTTYLRWAHSSASDTKIITNFPLTNPSSRRHCQRVLQHGNNESQHRRRPN